MNKDAVDDFLGDLNETEEVDPFAPENEDPFNAEEPKKEVEEDKEEKVPYHKDPKVQRYVEKEISKALKEFKPTETEKFVKETKADDDNYYERLIGNDTPEKIAMIKEAKARDERLIQIAEDRAVGRLTADQQKSIEEDRQAQEELRQGFEDIEETYNVDLTSNTPRAKQLRGEFVDFITRIAPKNSEGEVIAFPDLDASFEAFQEKKKAPTNTRAKDLASRSIARSTDTSITPTVKDNSWAAVDKLFAKGFNN